MQRRECISSGRCATFSEEINISFIAGMSVTSCDGTDVVILVSLVRYGVVFWFGVIRYL